MLDTPIANLDITVVDVETTGLNPDRGDRICEIGAITYRNSQEIARFHTLVNPRRPIPPQASAVNGITAELVAEAPDSSVVLPKFQEFIAGSVLAAYNAPFDMGFLRTELALSGQTAPMEPVIDVLWLARRFLPGLDRYSLSSVARALSVDHTHAHSALGDVAATGRIFYLLIPHAGRAGLDTLGSVIREQALNSLKRGRKGCP